MHPHALISSVSGEFFRLRHRFSRFFPSSLPLTCASLPVSGMCSFGKPTYYFCFSSLKWLLRLWWLPVSFFFFVLVGCFLISFCSLEIDPQTSSNLPSVSFKGQHFLWYYFTQNGQLWGRRWELTREQERDKKPTENKCCFPLIARIYLYPLTAFIYSLIWVIWRTDLCAVIKSTLSWRFISVPMVRA